MTESFNLSFYFTANWWNDNPPEYSISIDDKCLRKEVFKIKQEVVGIEVPVTIESGPHQLKIRYENKKNSDIYYLPNQNILRENFFTLIKFSVDTVDCVNLHKKEGYYKRDFPDKQGNLIYKNNGIFLHSGEYILNFYSPIHYWLLSKFDKTY